jgi:hypothetical protein
MHRFRALSSFTLSTALVATAAAVVITFTAPAQAAPAERSYAVSVAVPR